MKLVYAFDPLCGWCYASGPTIREVKSLLAKEASWRLLCGGLVTGRDERPIGEGADQLRRSMTEIEKATGVPFGRPFFERILEPGTWVKRSEPLCRAALLVQRHWPRAALEFGHALGAALYRDGLEPDSEEALRQAAREASLDEYIDANELLAAWNTPEAQALTEESFAEARQQGIDTFPSLCVQEEPGRIHIVTQGFVPARGILERLERFRP